VFRYERVVRFAEVDAARMVFFGRFCDYCHDALEGLFEALEGGYPRLTLVRDIGIPTVHIDLDFKAPLRYGDVALIEVEVLRIGERSVTFRHTFKRKADGVVSAIAHHVVVTARISQVETVPVPEDMRKLLARHVSGENVLPEQSPPQAPGGGAAGL
jgi:4-hydroxybenzoyl-CoA thioesterase